MSRLLYALLWHALLPLLPLRLLWRGRRQPEYLQHVAERFGRYASPASPGPCVWLHAVSVGEMRAAQPLVRALQQRFPDHRLLLTCMTPTGRATAAQLYGDSVDLAYLPWDLPWAVRAFVRHFRPRLGILMETEIWPALIAACHREQVPVVLANARLSERSARGYARIRGLIGPALGRLAHVAAQSPDDARRLQALGAQRVTVCGNSKFDIDPPPELLQRGAHFRQLCEGRRVFLCASTREGEEALLLQQRPADWPSDWLWLLVPRHPQRFAEVEQLCRTAGLNVQRRSDGEPVRPETQVWLGDSMGEMFAYYAACDLAFVGGSLLPFGAQNLIEPAAVGRAILIGPHTFNFAEATRHALAAGAAEQIASAAALWHRAGQLLQDDARREHMAGAGLAFSREHRGATARIVACVEAVMQKRDA